MKINGITMNDYSNAWKLVQALCPDWDIEKDTQSSERAGYSIYRDTKNFYNYICDLGDRLEINYDDNTTTNIRIEVYGYEI